ncbi:MAG: hypothetical protein RLY57_36 [Candidatus Parcubacteria bacterium]|jgi:hypothetical protein
MVPWILARDFPLPWLLPERFDSSILHNMLVPKDMDNPSDLLPTITQSGLRIIGWTHSSEVGEVIGLFDQHVCCLVTWNGLKFLAEHVPQA